MNIDAMSSSDWPRFRCPSAGACSIERLLFSLLETVLQLQAARVDDADSDCQLRKHTELSN
jgi:hypothetical protein